MVTALIFAGGVGVRMNTKAKPKQFLELHGKPVLIYTIEYFEKNPEVDNITIVCLEDWIEELKRLLDIYSIHKVDRIVPGGVTANESVYKGLMEIEKNCNENAIVLIHDGVRPLITEELIGRNINCVRKNGNAITVEYARETVAITENGKITEVPKREGIRIAKAPQSFFLKDILLGYKRAKDDGLTFVDSAQLMQHYGYELYTVASSECNIKITSPTDYYIFRAIYEAKENSQILGL